MNREYKKMAAGSWQTHRRKSNIPHSYHAILAATPPAKKTKPEGNDSAAKLKRASTILAIGQEAHEDTDTLPIKGAYVPAWQTVQEV
jgi:hypothetical protein